MGSEPSYSQVKAVAIKVMRALVPFEPPCPSSVNLPVALS